MAENGCLCVKCVGLCVKCHSKGVKHGKTKQGKQRYFCKKCSKTFIDYYSYHAYNQTINSKIIAFTKENVGILGTARLLKISAQTVIKRIKSIASKIIQPAISINQSYEVDEMRTIVKAKTKLIWIVYALEKETKKVVSFNVGARTNKTLNVVFKTLHLASAKKIYTDKLINYKSLIDTEIHNFRNRATNLPIAIGRLV